MLDAEVDTRRERRWKNWDAMNSAHRLTAAQELLKGFYEVANKEVDEKTLKQNAQDFVNVLNEYSRIKQANAKK